MRVPQNQKVARFVETTNLGEMPSRTEKGNLDFVLANGKWCTMREPSMCAIEFIVYLSILSVAFAKDTLPAALQAMRVAR